MQTNKWKSVMEACVSNNGNDVKQGMQEFKELFIKELNHSDPTKRIKPDFVSLKSLAEAMLAINGNDYFDWNQDTKSISEALNTTLFPFITGELIHNVIIDKYNYWTDRLSAVYNEYTSTQAKYEYFAGIRAAAAPELVPQGHPYQTYTFNEKQCRCRVEKFGHNVELTRELVLADQFGNVRDDAAAAGEKLGMIFHRAVVETIMDSARTDFNESSSEAFWYGGSAQTVFSDDHSSIDGQTNDNSQAVAFGDTGLESAYELAGNMKDEAGDYILNDLKVCLVQPKLYKTAWQIFNPALPYTPGSSNFDPNFWKEGGSGRILPIASPYVSSNTAWYIGDFAREIRVYWGWRPETRSQGSESDANFERDIVLRYNASMKFGVCRSDYRRSIKGNS